MVQQITPFRGTQTIAGSVRERRNHLAELALQRGEQDIRRTAANTAAAKELRLSREQVREAVSLLPSAIEDAAKSVSQLPQGSRLAAFNTTMNPILQQARVNGIPVDELQRAFSQLTEEDFTPQAIEEFSATVKQGIGADGKPLFFQVGDQGSVRPIEGVTPQPRSGESITVGPDGSVQINRGPGAGLTKSNTTKVEKEVIDDSDILAKTRNVMATFRPEFQTISGRFDAAVSQVKAKLNVQLSRDEAESLRAFADYKANAAQLQSEVINQLAGAAVSESEAERINGFLIDPGAGLFDGDDPITAESKLKRYERNIQWAIARKQWFLRNGIEANEQNWNVHSLDGMPAIIKARHQEIVTELTATNPDLSAGEVTQMAIQQGKQEFGLL